MDARLLPALSVMTNRYDMVYSSHMIEHFTRPDALQILRGFLSVLKPDGLAFIRCPDIAQVNDALHAGADLDDEAYISPSGPITYRDIRDGYGPALAAGFETYRHRQSYDASSLTTLLHEAGFSRVDIEISKFDLAATAAP